MYGPAPVFWVNICMKNNEKENSQKKTSSFKGEDRFNLPFTKSLSKYAYKSVDTLLKDEDEDEEDEDEDEDE